MKTIILSCLLGVVSADLRMASQPKNNQFRLLQQGGGRNARSFVTGTGQNADGTTSLTSKGKVMYMEPSTFGYGGLKNQRQNNYDNFLRSNVDNEQDNRNFNNEVGLNHLPFRTFENAVPLTYPYIGTEKAGGDDDSLQNGQPQPALIRVSPGEPKMTPLRWNNPHAAEIEVNLWIMCATPPTIVRIKKPTCSGEGNQNNILRWAIPPDFNNVNWGACPSTTCFSGCKNPGDCVLQIYAHSVETRQYSTSVPIIIEGATVQGNNGIPYAAQPRDIKDSSNFLWKTAMHRSMVGGTANSGANQGGSNVRSYTLADVKLCASNERGGVSSTGAAADQAELKAVGQTAAIINAGTIHVYLCKRDNAEQGGEALVDKVVYSVYTLQNDGSYTNENLDWTENYAPYETKSENQFNGAAVKKIKAVLTAFSGATREVNVLLDARPGSRWRFRRHLQAACPTVALPEPPTDPWLNLSLLKREVCLPANDPNANYQTTTIQRAIMYSDVANHAFQNSNYSPYSGQQHDEISRNLQAAAVIHMTSSNGGELGKNNLPADVKAKLKQLNNKVNNLYQAYEKVANKVIDALSKDVANRSGPNNYEGIQPLGDTFRGIEKGATSTKRLKTTTYVPSFNVAGYNMNTIQNAINKNAGRNGKYADLLSAAKPGSNARFIEIYQATMNKMLPDFQAAEKLGITYMPGIRMDACSSITDVNLQTKSKVATKALQPATACCTQSMQAKGLGACGNTLPSPTQFRKRNAAGRKDGGAYASKIFANQRFLTQYQCPAECMALSASDIKSGTQVMKALSKTSAGVCVNYLAGSGGCVSTYQNGATDCRMCIGPFNNVAAKAFTGSMAPSNPFAPQKTLDGLINRAQSESALPDENPGNVLQTDDAPLTIDNTAVCWSASSFTCPNGKTAAGFLQDVESGKCVEVESTKIDNMCDDGPCDNDPESLVCRQAKANCDVDPDSGMKCMSGNENDPCLGCVKTPFDGTGTGTGTGGGGGYGFTDGANVITIAVIPLLLASLMY